MDPWNQGQRMMAGHQRGGHQQGGHQQGGHQQGGHQRGGHQQGGHQRGGHQQGGHQRGGHQQAGHQQAGPPQNANLPQNFYRPANSQQFYPNQSGLQNVQSHPSFQPGPIYHRNRNPMPQHFLPGATQSQPSRQLTKAEIDEMRKKKNFEEQQRRLLALKQGQSGKTQMDNPLNDLFGKKGSASINKSSFLGSLGDSPKPKEHNPRFSSAGSVIPSQTRPGFSSTNTAPALSNWNVQGSGISSQTTTSAGPEHFEEFQGFAKGKLQDDFGDFQHSTANQSFVNNVQNALPPTSSSGQSCTPVIMMNKQDVTNPSTSKTSKANTTIKEPSQLQAAATPSIEELMKKSLTLDNQPIGSAKKFQKPKLPKLPKLVKSEPSHFTESAKASKWNNLESLSEVFTIPQPAVVQPEPASGQNELINTSGDDWSDFSGVDQSGGLFQESGTQEINQGSSDFHPVKPEHGLLNYGDGIQSKPGFSGMPGVFSSGHTGMPTVQPGVGTSGWLGSDFVSAKQNGHESQAITEGTAISAQIPVEDTRLQQSNGGLAVQQVDPEQQIYGVQLPGWSKDTSLLPAVYKHVYQICSNDGGISTSQLYPLLLLSELPRDKLGHIWTQCNKAVLGQLNEQELYLLLGMVALAQVGLQMNKLTLEKLASCTTPPIPSFPEKIFQIDVESMPSVPPQQAVNLNNETPPVDKGAYSNESGSMSALALDAHSPPKPLHTVDAIKQPDWSKWKTSKAGHVDDKFNDFQTLIPKDRSASFQEQYSSGLPNLNFNTTPVMTDSLASFGSFQASDTNVQAPLTGMELTNNPSNLVMATKDLSGASSVSSEKPGGQFGVFQTQSGHSMTINGQNSFPEMQSASIAGTITDTNTFGDFTSAGTSSQDSYVENKTSQASTHFMSVPLQAAQRYMLSEEDESIDHHEKAWLKCLTSCFAVITKSYQILQTISDPQLMNEIFSSQQGISHFSAIIEIYCVSQRIRASVLKSAPNNMKLKESLQNIDNVWKTCLGFQSFKALLPSQSLNFSGCHVDENEDLNLTCGVCLLNVDKSWVNSLVTKGRSRKLSYGSHFYHTTCANFWCNKVDSVLPALQLNVGNSLI